MKIVVYLMNEIARQLLKNFPVDPVHRDGCFRIVYFPELFRIVTTESYSIFASTYFAEDSAANLQ